MSEATPCLAQNRAVILGSVRDTSGAAIPNASVSVLNEATGIRRLPTVTRRMQNYSDASQPK